MMYTLSFNSTDLIILGLILLWFFLPVIVQLKNYIYSYNRYRKPGWVLLAIIVCLPLLATALVLRALAYIFDVAKYWFLRGTEILLGTVIKDDPKSK